MKWHPSGGIGRSRSREIGATRAAAPCAGIRLGGECATALSRVGRHLARRCELCIAHDRQADPVPLSQHKIHERPLTTLLGHSASLSERLFLPLTGHPARRRGMPESGGYLPLGLWVSTVPYPIPERTFGDVSTSRSATAGTRQQRASRRPRLPNQSFSDLLSGAEKPGGISAFLPKLHSVLL